MTDTTEKYAHTTITVAVHREGVNPLYGEGATQVTLEDEAAGAFIVLQQADDHPKTGECRFDIEELEHVVKVARELYDQYNTGK